jgi:hypothetical protein
VNDLDRVKLLFGPYEAPLLKRGDRATCLNLDCGVVITSWTDGLIPWPRCRALEPPGGGCRPPVEEVLARVQRRFKVRRGQ